MNVAYALQNIQNIYIEAPPLIYYVEEHPKYVVRMESILQVIEQTGILVQSSVITLTEIVSHPIKLGNTKIENEYRDILLNTDGLTLHPVSVQIADKAALLRAKYNLRTPDALHIATAIDTQCDALLTNDYGLARITELSVMLLDTITL